MKKKRRNRSQSASNDSCRPLDPDERRRQRELLAERIGQLLARYWLKKCQEEQESSNTQASPASTDD